MKSFKQMCTAGVLTGPFFAYAAKAMARSTRGANAGV